MHARILRKTVSLLGFGLLLAAAAPAAADTLHMKGGGTLEGIVTPQEEYFRVLLPSGAEAHIPIVDVERGVVVASGFFDHANTFDRYTLTDGREMRTVLKWPNSISLLEAFKIRNGEIYRIEADFKAKVEGKFNEMIASFAQ